MKEYTLDFVHSQWMDDEPSLSLGFMDDDPSIHDVNPLFTFFDCGVSSARNSFSLLTNFHFGQGKHW
jgi:hypothetical protein